MWTKRATYQSSVSRTAPKKHVAIHTRSTVKFGTPIWSRKIFVTNHDLFFRHRAIGKCSTQIFAAWSGTQKPDATHFRNTSSTRSKQISKFSHESQNPRLQILSYKVRTANYLPITSDNVGWWIFRKPAKKSHITIGQEPNYFMYKPKFRTDTWRECCEVKNWAEENGVTWWGNSQYPFVEMFQNRWRSLSISSVLGDRHCAVCGICPALFVKNVP